MGGFTVRLGLVALNLDGLGWGWFRVSLGCLKLFWVSLRSGLGFVWFGSVSGRLGLGLRLACCALGLVRGSGSVSIGVASVYRIFKVLSSVASGS